MRAHAVPLDADFRRVLALGSCKPLMQAFDARKMMQNGGRVVAIGSIFDMNIKAYVRSMVKMWTIEVLVMADPKTAVCVCSTRKVCH